MSTTASPKDVAGSQGEQGWARSDRALFLFLTLFWRRVLERQLCIFFLFYRDKKNDAIFVVAQGKRLPDVFVRDCIDHAEIRVGAALNNAASNLQFHVGIGEIDNGNR